MLHTSQLQFLNHHYRHIDLLGRHRHRRLNMHHQFQNHHQQL
jgi:hypothetical protein